MKKTALMPAVMAVTLAGATGFGWGAEKIAVVNMNRLVQAHPDTKEAEATLEQQVEEFETEQAEMLEQLEKLKTEFDDLREQTRSKVLSEEGRARKRTEAEEKLTTLRDYELKARETALRRQRQLGDERKRMRDRILDKLRAVVNDYAEKHRYAVVLDSGPTGLGTKLVVYRSDGIDITEDILKLIKKED
jgi:Skp family chaperone for outer membrane proteins